MPLAFAHAGTADAAPRPDAKVGAYAAVSSAERTTVRLLNRERARHGLHRLRINRKLNRSAGRYSRYMVRRGFFSHNAPSGSTPSSRIRKTGYMRGARRWHIGENLAWGGGHLGSPREIVRSWMASPGHRANILSRSYREIGIGIASGGPGYGGPAATYTTHFGARS